MTDCIRLPMTVLGGFLGSGKTTLVNNILNARHGLRILVMVNDFGSINVDSTLIESGSTAQGVVSLTNGCICCTMGSELVATLMKVELLAPKLDWVIIESSGVSDPKKIAQIGRAGAIFQLRSIVTLADASSIREAVTDHYVGDMALRQLRSAHLILLNKIDLVDEEQRSDTSNWLSEVAPHAFINETVNAEVDWDVLLNSAPPDGAMCAYGSDGAFDFAAHFRFRRDDSTRQFTTLTIEQSAPYDPEKLKRALGALGSSVFRIKGVISVGGNTDLFLLQYSPNGRYELEVYEVGDRSVAGKLVVVGSSSLNLELLRRTFSFAQVERMKCGSCDPV